MKIAILGGTGKEGRGLAMRWANAGVEVMIGSRDPEKAGSAAALLNTVPGRAPVRGLTNREAAVEGDVVVVSVPAAGHRLTLESLQEELSGKIVIDVVVPLDPTDMRRYLPPPEGSAAEEAQAVLGKDTPVVAALHHISFHLLRQAKPIECDVMACGDSEEAKREVIRLVRLIDLRTIDCGALVNARVIEGLTPILLDINKRYRVKSSGIKITGIDMAGE
jgi:NADPH-dependent F420 reductase